MAELVCDDQCYLGWIHLRTNPSLKRHVLFQSIMVVVGDKTGNDFLLTGVKSR